jgi:hypothetical protein
MSHVGLTDNIHAKDILEGDAEASAPNRRCIDGSIQSDFELLSSDLAKSECGIPEVEGCSNMDLNDGKNVDSSFEVSPGSNEAATTKDHCKNEPTRPLRVDPTLAIFAIRQPPPKRFPRAMWRGLIRRAVAHIIASSL